MGKIVHHLAAMIAMSSWEDCCLPPWSGWRPASTPTSSSWIRWEWGARWKGRICHVASARLDLMRQAITGLRSWFA